MKSKLIPIFSFASIMPLSIASGLVSCSFNRVEDNNDIPVQLFASRLYITAQDTIQINVLNDKVENYKWSITTTMSGVWVDQNGVLYAGSQCKVDIPTVITVCVKHKTQERTGTIDITFVEDQDPTKTNFLGFLGNKITYIDRYSKPVDVPIVATKPGLSYTLAKPIDLFFEDTLPEGYTSWIDFDFVVRNKTSKLMTFRISDSGQTFKSIMWDGDYNEGDEVDYIPNFHVAQAQIITTKMIVEFCCNDMLSTERTTLVIPITLWSSKGALTNGIFSYFPTGSDPHYITPSEIEGTYYANLYCPGTKKRKIYSDFMAPIYCYREEHEYLDFEFEINTDRMDSRLKDVFSVDLKVERHEREIDHYPMYLLTLTYSFDLSNPKMPTAEQCDYATLPLFELRANDPLIQGDTSVCWIDFNLCWI